MELHRIRITNFRSIKDLIVYLSPKCRVLVGINEPGKTNILRALSMRNKDQVLTDDDKRDPLPDEPPVTEPIFKKLMQKYPSLCELSEDQLNDSGGKLYIIDEWLKKGGIDQQEKKAVLNEIKEEIFNSLKAAHIEEGSIEFQIKFAKLL